MDRDPRGLSATYQANEDGKYAYFYELPPIEDYPAVAADIADGRPDGWCTVAVGVSDEIIFIVPIRLSPVNVGKNDPCKMAAQVAGMALQTIKKG